MRLVQHLAGLQEHSERSLLASVRLGAVSADKLLSPHCRKRLTVENDDWPSAFSVRDLLPLSQQCGVPIVFDWHHHR